MSSQQVDVVVPPGRTVIYDPDNDIVSRSQLSAFAHYCAQRTEAAGFSEQAHLQRFSTNEFRRFWRLFLGWSGLLWDGDPEAVCTDDRCEHASFFPGIRLSYVENLLLPRGQDDDAAPALTAVHGDGRPPERLSRGELRALVGRAAAGLSTLGIRAGDRVVAIVNNDAEAVIACLATLALGATFSSASPDMGGRAILSRFAQLDPKLLFFTTAGAQPGGRERVRDVIQGLPGLQAVVGLGEGNLVDIDGHSAYRLRNLIDSASEPLTQWPRFGFNHPLFILFSSGTTGVPKCIVHGAGGTLIEHVKEHRLHCDLRMGETLFFHTSSAWMMWNWQLSALACGAEIILFDGVVSGPDTLWRIAAAHKVSVFGTSPAYLRLCLDQGFRPDFALPALRSVLSTGSILYDSQFDWVVENIKHVPVQSISGGTDIIGCFVLGSPNLPVWRGEAQCRSLGLDVQALGEPGQPGELVCCNPFPSRPLGFWGDSDGTRFHAAYFSKNPGIWTHGDFISFTPEGSARLHGRSDGVMNIRGIRVGPADIYAALQGFPEIREAMAVEQQAQSEPGGSRIALLVVLQPPAVLDADLGLRIRKAIGRHCSPVHVPAIIADVAALPTTHSGKRSETAARAAVNGEPVENREALANPECLDAIARHPALRPPDQQAQSTGSGGTLEEELQAIWEAAFGFAPVGMNDNFFELGGNSLLAMAIFAVIRQRFDRKLPIVTLFRAPTIAALAAVMRADTEDRFACLNLVLPGRGEPLFLVHGLSGTVLELAHLLQALRDGRPVYVLQARGLDPGSTPDATVEVMAERYLREIRTVQPTGPYAICGFSFGGLVAYEMARRLVAGGEGIELLALVDTEIHPRFLSWREWIGYRQSRLALLARGLITDPRRAIAAEIHGILNSVLLHLGRGPHWQDAALAALPPVLQRVRGACEQAYATYRPLPYPGRVTYFRAAERNPRICDPLGIWRRVTQLEVITLPAGHFDLVRPPCAADLAAALRARLGDLSPACPPPSPERASPEQGRIQPPPSSRQDPYLTSVLAIESGA